MCAQKTNKKTKNRTNKIHLVFDEEKRRDFLTGFHKRKVQRKKDAKEKFEKDLKEERKRLKAEAKEAYKKLIVSHRPIPELESLLENQYEDEDVHVKVVELSTNDIASQNHWIGANQPKYDDDSDVEEENDEEEPEEIPGMELKPKKVGVLPEKIKSNNLLNNKKDVKRVLKLQATKNVKKSKVFQLKNKIEKQKQKRQSLKQKRENEKRQNKFSKHKNKLKK